MLGKLILSHGDLAAAILRAVERISGCPPDGFRALCLDWDERADQAAARVGQAIAEIDQGEGVLILVDMYGGTPYNVASRYREPGRIEVLAGVNLPMALRLACAPAQFGSLRETAEWLQNKGQNSIVLAKSG